MRNIVLKIALCGIIANMAIPVYAERSLWTRISDNSFSIAGLMISAALIIPSVNHLNKNKAHVDALIKAREEAIKKRNPLKRDIKKLIARKAVVPNEFIQRIDKSSYTKREQKELKERIGSYNTLINTQKDCSEAQQDIYNFIASPSQYQEIVDYKTAEVTAIAGALLATATIFVSLR